MEPTDLNSSAHEDAQLTAMLRRAAPALSDNGFSARVLTALPAPEAKRMQWGRIAFCVVGAAAGCGLVLWQGISLPDVRSGGEEFAAQLLHVTSAFANPLAITALVVTMLSLLVAFRAELREKLLSE